MKYNWEDGINSSQIRHTLDRTYLTSIYLFGAFKQVCIVLIISVMSKQTHTIFRLQCGIIQKYRRIRELSPWFLGRALCSAGIEVCRTMVCVCVCVCGLTSKDTSGTCMSADLCKTVINNKIKHMISVLKSRSGNLVWGSWISLAEYSLYVRIHHIPSTALSKSL